MEYVNFLLKKDKSNLGELKPYFEIFDFLSNQQELKKSSRIALNGLPLKGEVSLLSYNEGKDGKFELIDCLGDKAKIELYLEERKVLKLIQSTKRPFFKESEPGNTEPYFMAFPILSKDEFVGALCIHEEQEIASWKEISIFLNLFSVAIKFYQLVDASKDLSKLDMVSELHNYGYFQNHLELEVQKALRYRSPLSIVLVNIEGFRKINERLGFDSGDSVLRQVSKWIKGQCRTVDMPARLDGDTFAILLSNTPIRGAQELLRRILLRVENNTVEAGGTKFSLRVKGVALAFDPQWSKDEFLEQARSQVSRQ